MTENAPKLPKPYKMIRKHAPAGTVINGKPYDKAYDLSLYSYNPTIRNYELFDRTYVTPDGDLFEGINALKQSTRRKEGAEPLTDRNYEYVG